MSEITGSFILMPEPLECAGRVGSMHITYCFMLAGVEWMQSIIME